jgi:uncharacterized protein (DUF302 family)
MLYVRTAKGSLDEVCRKLETAVTDNKFGVLGVHDLKEKMAAKGVRLEPACRIFEVCNPMQAKRVLEADMRISTALPCRISVYEERGTVQVATMRPTAVLKLFGAPELEPVAREVEAVVLRIVDAACS